MFNVKITIIMPFRDNIVKNANLSPSKIACFLQFAKILHAKISTFTVLHFGMESSWWSMCELTGYLESVYYRWGGGL